MTPKEFKTTQEKLGMTNKDMAKILKSSVRSIENWRGGKRKIPGPAIVALYYITECWNEI